MDGVAEILDGRGGQLEPGRDPQAWAASLRRLVSDYSVGVAIAAAARERYLKAFTAAAAAERVVAIYREALAS